jgi:hypothetical protein
MGYQRGAGGVGGVRERRPAAQQVGVGDQRARGNLPGSVFLSLSEAVRDFAGLPLMARTCLGVSGSGRAGEGQGLADQVLVPLRRRHALSLP